MPPVNFDSTLEIVAQLDAARSSEELCAALLHATSHLGVEQLIGALIPPPAASMEIVVAGVYLSKWPIGWLERYALMGYADDDPMIALVRRELPIFAWRDAPALIPQSEAGLRVMNEASEFDIRDGVTVSLRTQEGLLGGMSFSGTRMAHGVKERQLLSIVANYAFVKALKLDARRNAASVLSDRQRDVLRWVANGKTDWEISVILNISEHTVDKYMRAIKEKLGANNRVNAIARAMRLGLID